jgi:dTMP kinase
LLPDFDASLARARRRNDRTAKSGTDENRFEREDEVFYRRAYEKYREIAIRDHERVVAIESDASIDEIHQRILRVVEERLQP